MQPLAFTGLPVWAQIVIEITVVLGFLAALFPLARRAWKALGVLIKVGDAIPALVGLPDFIDRTDKTLKEHGEQIAEIHHEVQFNNGSSVKDAVGRVEGAQKTNTAAIRRIERGVKGLYARTAALEELEQTQPAIRQARSKK